MRSAIFTEFATITAPGVPIDTPTYSFIAGEGASLDVTTGLAYPAKAERARRNPKVGLLLETSPDKPIVSISALAAVRDANIQANTDRYITEIIAYLDAQSGGKSWSAVRNAVWYWSRIFVLCFPKRILWWPSAADTESPPMSWSCPAEFDFPGSDPAPTSPPSPPASWPISNWQERAEKLIDQRIVPHLTLIDDDGFPLPMRVRAVTLTRNGFGLDVPAGAPWKLHGKASLCFSGMATFIGQIGTNARDVEFAVDRMMPDLPMVQDPKEVFEPSPGTRTALMTRLEHELRRRGQGVPTIFAAPPPPTEGSRLRAERVKRMLEELSLRSRESSGNA
jgi:hypothetical protein